MNKIIGALVALSVSMPICASPPHAGGATTAKAAPATSSEVPYVSAATCELIDNSTDTNSTQWTVAQQHVCTARLMHDPVGPVPMCMDVTDAVWNKEPLSRQTACIREAAGAHAAAQYQQSWERVDAAMAKSAQGVDTNQASGGAQGAPGARSMLPAFHAAGTLLCAPNASPCAPHGMIKDAYEVIFNGAPSAKSCDTAAARADIIAVYVAVYGGNAAEYRIPQKHIPESVYPNGIACNTIAENADWGMVKNGAILFLQDQADPSNFRGAMFYTGFVDSLSIMAGGTSK